MNLNYYNNKKKGPHTQIGEDGHLSYPFFTRKNKQKPGANNNVNGKEKSVACWVVGKNSDPAGCWTLWPKDFFF